MDMFVGVAVFVVALVFMLAAYGYVVRRRHAEETKKAEIDKAWKREQNRQRRAHKKVLTAHIIEEAKQQQNISEQQANAAWVKPEWTQQ